MHEPSLITDTLNKYFGNLATQVLHAVHVQPYNPQAPITETFAMEILVLGLLLIFFVLVRLSLNVEKPGPIQQIAEMLHGFVSDQADSIIGHGSQRYVMFTTCVLMFVLPPTSWAWFQACLRPLRWPRFRWGSHCCAFSITTSMECARTAWAI
jgi:F-type H+-transporting ATPase subunit a